MERTGFGPNRTLLKLILALRLVALVGELFLVGLLSWAGLLALHYLPVVEHL